MHSLASKTDCYYKHNYLVDACIGVENCLLSIRYQDLGYICTRYNELHKGFVDGNFECEFYTAFIRSNQKQLRTIGPLARIEPATLPFRCTMSSIKAKCVIVTKVSK
jgi:hypothetical protein